MSPALQRRAVGLREGESGDEEDLPPDPIWEGVAQGRFPQLALGMEHPRRGGTSPDLEHRGVGTAWIGFSPMRIRGTGGHWDL